MSSEMLDPFPQFADGFSEFSALAFPPPMPRYHPEIAEQSTEPDIIRNHTNLLAHQIRQRETVQHPTKPKPKPKQRRKIRKTQAAEPSDDDNAGEEGDASEHFPLPNGEGEAQNVADISEQHGQPQSAITPSAVPHLDTAQLDSLRAPPRRSRRAAASAATLRVQAASRAEASDEDFM